MLIVDVSQLLVHVGETQQVEVSYELELQEEDFKVIPPVQLDLTLISTGKTILAQGVISGQLELICARCLRSFKKPYKFEVEEEYKKLEELMTATAKDKELGEDDFVFTIDGEGQLNLHEVVRQNILVNLPLKFICRENCPGIKDKVKSKKVKVKKEGDPRLAKLKELKERK